MKRVSGYGLLYEQRPEEGERVRAACEIVQGSHEHRGLAHMETKTVSLLWPPAVRPVPWNRIVAIGVQVLGQAMLVGSEVDLEHRTLKVTLHNPVSVVQPFRLVSRWWYLLADYGETRAKWEAYKREHQ